LPREGRGDGHPDAGHDDPVRGDHDPAVPHVRRVRHGQLAVRGDHPVYLHPAVDPAVPAGVALVPLRDHRGRPHRRTQGALDLRAHLRADDEVHLRCGGGDHVHGVVEQLPLAARDPARQCGSDHAHAHREPHGGLRHRLRCAHARRAADLSADHLRLPHPAAGLRAGHHRSHQVTSTPASTPAFDIDRIADPEFFSENRIPAHSDHRWFADLDEARTGSSSFEQSLNGLWKFHCAKNQGQTIPGFEQSATDVSGWDDIPVPSHLPLQGYDRPQYVNVGDDWDGQEDIEPGQVPVRDNPIGSYVRTFELDRPLGDGERLSVTFHGAESAIALWLNGRYIGYSTDSFTPSEFDLTDA